jgi:uncharacterized RDD family membrane protein YckC
MLDTMLTRSTPEGCALDLRPADPTSRALAWLIDSLTRVMIWMACVQALSLLGVLGTGLLLVMTFALEWLVPVLFEVLWAGQTPGKKAVGLVVLHDDGTPVGWRAAFVRNTLRFVDFLPIAYATGFVTLLLDPYGRRLGDLVAGTLVVHAPQPQPLSLAASRGLGSEAPSVRLHEDERRAILEYAARVHSITDERALELAVIPAPLVQGDAPEEARARLLRVANHLLGER